MEFMFRKFCVESEVIQNPAHLSSAALVPMGVRSQYVASAVHYQAVAKRIVGALRSGPFVLVTGDPPANPRALSGALVDAATPGSSVITISCRRELRRNGLERTVPVFARQKAGSLIFLFNDFDRLSDTQIEDLCNGTLCSERMQRPAVLLAQMDFQRRLEQPALQFLRDHIAARLHFQEVGDDEAIAVLHNQLLSQPDRRLQARGFHHGILAGLATGAALLAASVGALVLYPAAEPVGEPPAAAERGSSLGEEASTPQPLAEGAISEGNTGVRSQHALSHAEAALMLPPGPPSASLSQPPTAKPTSGLATAPPSASLPQPASAEATSALASAPSSAPLPQPTTIIDQRAAHLPAATEPAARPRLSATAINELLARGDAFLEAGDIGSARLYYERAADAESGPAALRMGATFDTVLAGRVVRGAFTADPDKALFWYRRAGELGVAEAERRIKALETPPAIGPDYRPSSK
jgi:hypothetical protein